MVKRERVNEIGAQLGALDSQETAEFNRGIKRFLEDTRTLDTEATLEKLLSYKQEIQTAVEVAKDELQGSFDGQFPASNNFGMSRIDPGYFGYDDWDDAPTFTGGSASDWIDNDTPTNMSGGSSGFSNPLRVGDPAVHLVLGIGSYAEDPVTSRVKWEKNGDPYAAVQTEDEFRNTDVRMKWLDTPVILQPQDEFAARVFAGGEVSSSYEDAPYLWGLSFVESKKLRLLDRADMAGTSENDVVEQV